MNDDLTPDEKKEISYFNGGKDLSWEDLKSASVWRWLVTIVLTGGLAGHAAAKIILAGVAKLVSLGVLS